MALSLSCYANQHVLHYRAFICLFFQVPVKQIQGAGSSNNNPENLRMAIILCCFVISALHYYIIQLYL